MMSYEDQLYVWRLLLRNNLAGKIAPAHPSDRRPTEYALLVPDTLAVAEVNAISDGEAPAVDPRALQASQSTLCELSLKPTPRLQARVDAAQAVWTKMGSQDPVYRPAEICPQRALILLKNFERFLAISGRLAS